MPCGTVCTKWSCLLCPSWGKSYYNPEYRRQFTWDYTGNSNASGRWVTSTKCKSREGSHLPLYIYLFIFWPESFLLNMKAIFEHWTVTLLGCLLVDKTWKSNLLSWACLRIYSAERGGVERQATSSFLSQIPACFLRNEMEGGEVTPTHPHTHANQGNDSVSLPPALSSCPLF